MYSQDVVFFKTTYFGLMPRRGKSRLEFAVFIALATEDSQVLPKVFISSL